MTMDGMADMDDVTIALEHVLAAAKDHRRASRVVDDSALTPSSGGV